MSEKVQLKILYIEDEPDLRERIRIVLDMYFHPIIVASNGIEGLKLFTQHQPDVIVSDIRMPAMDGLEFAHEIRKIAPDIPFIFTTAFTETDYLIKAIELGISAYVRKPIDCRLLVDTITRASAPILQNRALDEERKRAEISLQLLLGESSAMRAVAHDTQRIAETDFSVLILGETGVGKSHLAAVIHGLSSRRHKPFVTVTLGSMTESLVEAQLFGHIRGAFTGAISTKKGLFEEALGGTIFLDDVDCASQTIQAKILHVVEQKHFYPVGSTKPVEVDTRIITASNCDLLQKACMGAFREDLYYRLSDMVIMLPPLLKRFDAELVDRLVDASNSIGMTVRKGFDTSSIEKIRGSFIVHGSAGRAKLIKADLVVNCAGRVPDLDGLDLAAGKVTRSKQGIAVNRFLQNKGNPRIYAIGDACGAGPQLAPVADMEAAIVAENILNGNIKKPNYIGVPSILFTQPPLAMVGMTEVEASASGIRCRINRGSMSDWPSSRRIGQKNAYYKVIIEEESGRILGAHLFGHNAGEAINIFAMAIKFGLNNQNLKKMLWAYPTNVSDLKYMID